MVEVNVAVTLGLACERVRSTFGGSLESRNCLAGLRDVCAPMGVSAGLLEEVLYKTLVLQTLTCEFLRKSRTKRSFWRLDV